MSLEQEEIMLGVKVRCVHNGYRGLTGTINKVHYDPYDPDFISSVAIKWNTIPYGNRDPRLFSEWWNPQHFDIIREPGNEPLMFNELEVGWKVQLRRMPYSKFFNKPAVITKVSNGPAYFITQFADGKQMRWRYECAPLFTGLHKKTKNNPRKIRKAEREILLARAFFHGVRNVGAIDIW